MVANQGKITTLNDGISGTTGLTDGTDKMHSGILGFVCYWFGKQGN